jgi:signal transduction histidine kinase
VRTSIRLRLTIVYAVILVVASAALLALNYILLYGRLYGPIDPAGGGPAPLAGGDQVKQSAIDQLRAAALVSTAGTSAIALVVTAVVGLGVSWWVAGRMLRPLRTLTATTRRISHDRLDQRVALTGPADELKELADTFDEMIGRLEASFAGQRRFVADASHELRTPLAIVRTGAEVLLAKKQPTAEQWQAMARRALIAAGRAERLLDGLLALARSDSGAIAHEPHDLAIAAATALAGSDEAAELALTTDLAPAPVSGDPALLDHLVGNLIDNAVRHNHPDGWVRVVTGHRSGVATVIVSNGGEQVPAAEVERLFEPFRRLGADRRSTGLGLAIVRSIVRAHGGTVAADPNPDGGLTVTVSLPAG